MMFSLYTFLLWFGVVASVLFAIVYVFFTWYYGYWEKRGVPNLKPSFPFGNFGDLIMQRISLMDYYIKLYTTFERQPLAGYISIIEPVLLIRDPEIIKSMLVKDFSYFHDRGIRFDEQHDPLAAHLFNISGQRWHDLRHKLSPTFTSGKMRYMFPLIKSIAEEFQRTVMREISEKGNELEVKDLNARYTTDVIGSAAFGVDAGSLAKPDAEMRVIGRKIFSSDIIEAWRSFIFFLSPRVSELLRLKLISPFVEKSLIRIVSDAIKHREESNIERKDFLQLLIKLKNNSLEIEDKGNTPDDIKKKGDNRNTPDVELNEKQMCAQCFVFFVGGFETSATAMTFCLYELARHPGIQQELACEVERVLENHNGELTYEGISEMHLMERVVAEALRMYPPVPILLRECTKDYVLKRDQYPNLLTKDHPEDLLIEKGTKVIFPTCALHRDPKHYPDPDRFDPERFTEEAKKQRPGCTYLPFGEGPRFCIGMRFGNMQAKAGLASLISKYEFRLSPKSSGKLDLDPASFVPTSKGGMFIQFHPRKK